LLDHRFVEWSASLPSALKLHDGVGKYVFKRALESRLPHDILYRPKQGFAVPISAWFRGPLSGRIRRMVSSARLAETGWLDIGYIGKAVEQHIAGLRDHGTMLWSLLMFEAFLNDVHDGSGVTSPA